MISVEQVKEWFKQAEDEDQLYASDVGYLDEGDHIDLENLPEGIELVVVATNTERTYNSYGYSELTDGYVVFEVKEYGKSSGIFKLPMTYSSYESWDYEVDNIAPTVKQEKVITTWEWV